MSCPCSCHLQHCQGFYKFCDELEISDDASVYTNEVALKTIFKAANLEEGLEITDAEANDNESLLRFEFMDSLFRIGIHKYLKTNVVKSPQAAIDKLFNDILIPAPVSHYNREFLIMMEAYLNYTEDSF